jgi:hypothetical protein
MLEIEDRQPDVGATIENDGSFVASLEFITLIEIDLAESGDQRDRIDVFELAAEESDAAGSIPFGLGRAAQSQDVANA